MIDDLSQNIIARGMEEKLRRLRKDYDVEARAERTASRVAFDVKAASEKDQAFTVQRSTESVAKRLQKYEASGITEKDAASFGVAVGPDDHASEDDGGLSLGLQTQILMRAASTLLTTGVPVADKVLALLHPE